MYWYSAAEQLLVVEADIAVYKQSLPMKSTRHASFMDTILRRDRLGLNLHKARLQECSLQVQLDGRQLQGQGVVST